MISTNPAPSPRVRGDQPASAHSNATSPCFSPRERGSTRHEAVPTVLVAPLPVCAGINPTTARPRRKPSFSPRVVGDQPGGVSSHTAAYPFSPRARGSTPARQRSFVAGMLLPACTGINPACCRHGPATAPSPCVRGDQPRIFPRQRWQRPFSPRARGSTRGRSAMARTVFLLPALAGINLPRFLPRRFASSSPRVRGDQPRHSSMTSPSPIFSPRARGSSPTACRRVSATRLLLASAGIDLPHPFRTART